MMDRLTFDGNFCDIAMCDAEPEYCGGTCSQRKVWERLKYYEDLEEQIGFEMEDVKTLFDGMRGKEWVELDDDLQSLLKAQREGRLVVLPCKVGDEVWDKDGDPWKVISVEWFSRKVTHLHCVSPITGYKHTFSVGKRSVGKTVFLPEK